MSKITIHRIAFWSLGTAVLLQFILPFVYPISGHDAAVHLNWLEQFPRLFREGNLYPRWMPDSFWGFGSPAFYFYPPLAYWCASVISFIFPDSPVAIYHTLGLLASLASIGTCYLYLRSLVGRKRSAIIGALVYGVFPYRLVDLYLRNAIGEHVAFVFLPIVLLGIEIVLRQSSSSKKDALKSMILSAIGFSGLLLTNIPTSVIALYSVPIYALIRAAAGKKYRKLLFAFIGSLVGAMIAALYLIPAIAYSSRIKLSHLWDLQASEGNSGYALLDVLHGNYRYFYMGLLATFLVGGWLAYRFYRSGKNSGRGSIDILCFVFLLIATVIQIPYLFQPLWNILPGLKFIQFSYRWDILIVLAAAIYVAANVPKAGEKTMRWFIAGSSGVTIIIAVGYFLTMDGLGWRYKPMPGHIDAPEYITASVKNNSYQDVKNMYRSHADDPFIMTDSIALHLHILSANSKAIAFTVDRPSPDIVVAFHRMFFPAWTLSSNDDQGLMFADSVGRFCTILERTGTLVTGNYSLYLAKSNEEKNGEFITCFGLAILSVLGVIIISSRNPKAS